MFGLFVFLRSDLDVPRASLSAVWRASALLVPAAPKSKLFVFGGSGVSTTEDDASSNSSSRCQAQLLRDLQVLTLAETTGLAWTSVPPLASAPSGSALRSTQTNARRKAQQISSNTSTNAAAAESGSTKTSLSAHSAERPLSPSPREGASLAYFADDSMLVVFGGWYALQEKAL